MLWSTQLAMSDSTPWHSHEVFELIFCIDGSGKIEVDDNSIELRPNRVILVMPYARHRYIFEGERSASLKIVCLTSRDSALYLSPVQFEMLQSLRPCRYTFKDALSDTSLLQELTKQVPEGAVVGNHSELLNVWGIVGLVLASHVEQPRYPLEKGHRYRSQLEEICRWLDEHLEESISLDRLSAKFAVSRSVLTKTFRQHTGTSIVDYLTSRRLEKAAVLLTSATGKDITQASLDSGFANLSNFHRRFKAAYGMTPAEFQRNFTR